MSTNSKNETPAKEYVKKLTLQTPDVDFTNHLKMETIFSHFQQIAEEHCAPLGLGYKDMREKGMFWAIVRARLSVHTLPSREETITLRTFASQNKRILFPRYYEGRDTNGRALFSASSIWTVVDFKERKALLPHVAGIHTDDMCSSLTPPVPLPGRVSASHCNKAGLTRVCEYSDLDVNGHMNNAKYLSWICDLIGYQRLSSHYIRDITISYHSEIKPQTKVCLAFYEEDGFFEVRASDKTGALLFFTAEGVLAPYRG